MAKKGYRREVLKCSDKKRECVWCVWRPGGFSKPHDHGDSAGLILVVSGCILEIVFDKKTKVELRRMYYDTGSVIEETEDTIHIMGNASKTEKAITLHVYSNPPLKMTEYKKNELHWLGERG